jgi:hypothetical protein
MQNFKSLIFFVLIAVVLFTGCKKEEATDIRESLIGTYTGSQMYTVQLSKISNLYSDSTTTYNIVLTVGIDNTISNGLIINELGLEGYPNFPYKANAVTATNDGVAFNITQQLVTTTSNGSINSMIINGLPLNNNSYDGHFTSSNSQLILAYSGTIQIVVPGPSMLNIPYTVINTCTKQ